MIGVLDEVFTNIKGRSRKKKKKKLASRGSESCVSPDGPPPVS